MVLCMMSFSYCGVFPPPPPHPLHNPGVYGGSLHDFIVVAILPPPHPTPDNPGVHGSSQRHEF